MPFRRVFLSKSLGNMAQTSKPRFMNFTSRVFQFLLDVELFPTPKYRRGERLAPVPMAWILLNEQ